MPIGLDRCIALTFWRPIANCIEPPSGFGCGAVGNFVGLLRIHDSGFWSRLLPKPLGSWQGINFEALPPGHFIASLMQLPMMTAAERHGELVADLETEAAGLRKPQVMRVRRLPPAYEAGVRRHKPQVRLLPDSLWLSKIAD